MPSVQPAPHRALEQALSRSSWWQGPEGFNPDEVTADLMGCVKRVVNATRRR